jgi:hypothetical protein
MDQGRAMHSISAAIAQRDLVKVVRTANHIS